MSRAQELAARGERVTATSTGSVVRVDRLVGVKIRR